MKKRGKTILLLLLAIAVFTGVLLFLFRVQPVVDPGFAMTYVDVEYRTSTDDWDRLELTDAQIEQLRPYLMATNMRRMSFNSGSYLLENVVFQVDIHGPDSPWHLVLGEPCFAYESAERARFAILKDEAYAALLAELEQLVAG